MERVHDAGMNILTVYENRIDEELHNYYERFISDSDMTDESAIDKYILESPQNRFNGALMYIRRLVFSNRKSLMTKDYTSTGNGQYIKSNNQYNYDLLNDICDYYIYLCNIYDKECSINGFCYLTGIDYDSFINGATGNYNGEKVSTEKMRLYKKLIQGNEDTVSAMLTGKRNPVGLLGILNHRHGWNMPGVSRETAAARPVLSVNELPRLDNVVQDAHIDEPVIGAPGDADDVPKAR